MGFRDALASLICAKREQLLTTIYQFFSCWGRTGGTVGSVRGTSAWTHSGKLRTCDLYLPRRSGRRCCESICLLHASPGAARSLLLDAPHQGGFESVLMVTHPARPSPERVHPLGNKGPGVPGAGILCPPACLAPAPKESLRPEGARPPGLLDPRSVKTASLTFRSPDPCPSWAFSSLVFELTAVSSFKNVF